MNQFNLGNFLNKVINYSLPNANQGATNASSQSANTDAKFQLTNEALAQSMLNKAPSSEFVGWAKWLKSKLFAIYYVFAHRIGE